MNNFSHINDKNQPKMVDVSDKKVTKRIAVAKAKMFVGEDIIKNFSGTDISTKKGPVFQTAIVAGIQAVKKTSDIIPMCHPLLINGIDITINILSKTHLEIYCKVTIEGKTGVEMEALTGASAACLTIYDMCKAIHQDMVIEELRLLEKKGGKSDIKKYDE